MGYIQTINYSGIGGSSSILSTRGMVLLTSVSLASQATVALTSLISSSYSNYYFVFSNLIITPVDRICLQISTNNGSTWIATGYESGNTSYAYNATAIANNTITTRALLSTNLTTNPGATGYCYLFNLQNAGNFICAGIFNTYVTGTNIIRYGFGGTYNATASVNALLITTLNGGTYTSGICSLYGIKQ